MSKSRFGLLSYPGIDNIGDTIQSLAARRFFPRVDVLLPRERLSDPPISEGRPVKTILNGWFMHNAAYWPPHPAIEPLLVSMHFVEPGRSRLRCWIKSPLARMLSGPGAEFLRRWGPVGARDEYSLEQLTARRIPAYHSGCLTLTLPRPDVAHHKNVLAVDLTPQALLCLKSRTRRRVISLTHSCDPTLDQVGQEQTATKLLSLYAGAAAVVTPRIHAAQPCLAFGTPVLLVTPDKPSRRVADVARLMQTCPLSDFIAGSCDYNFDNPPANPESFRPLADALIARCQNFVQDESLPLVGD